MGIVEFYSLFFTLTSFTPLRFLTTKLGVFMIDLLKEYCETGPLKGKPLAMQSEWYKGTQALASVLVEVKENETYIVETFIYAGSFWKVAESKVVSSKELGHELLQERAEWARGQQVKGSSETIADLFKTYQD